MQLTLEQKRNVRGTGQILVVAIAVALIYTAFSDGFASLYPYINAVIIAPVITLLVAFCEFIVFGRRIRKKGFRTVLTLRLVTYITSIIAIILLVVIFTRMVRYDTHFIEIIRSDEFQTYLREGDFKTLIAYVCALVALTIFTMQMSRKMGQGVLLSFILGRYRQPREVDRFLMFVRVLNAKALLEKLGNEGCLRYLNEVLYDVTDTILLRHGVIVEYVNDELLIVWEPDHGQERARCLRTYFDICDVLTREKLHYYEEYGVVPALSAALHRGTVVIGEIGEVKSEIVYSGDPVNTTYRMLGYATESGQLIASSEAIDDLEVPAIFSVSDIGSIRLRGKEKYTGLWLVTEH